MDFDRVVNLYEETQSIGETARQAGISAQKTRKILITTGHFVSRRSKDIAFLHDSGKPVEEIANRLGISEKLVISYLPYTRGAYGADDATDNAKKIRAWRQKRKYLHKGV